MFIKDGHSGPFTEEELAEMAEDEVAFQEHQELDKLVSDIQKAVAFAWDWYQRWGSKEDRVRYLALRSCHDFMLSCHDFMLGT